MSAVRYKLVGLEVEPGDEPFSDKVVLTLADGEDRRVIFVFEGTTEFSTTMHDSGYLHLSFSVRTQPEGIAPL